MRKVKIGTRNMVLTAMFAALTAAGAFIKIPLGPVPISLQTMFTLLAGVILGPYLGALSQLIYVVVGLAGIPVFTSGGGFSYIFNPGFGFLVGFIPAAVVCGLISGGKCRFPQMLAACAAASVVVYIIGVPYMYVILKYVTKTNITFLQTLKTGCLLFIPGDIAKIVIASAAGYKIKQVLQHIQ